MEAALMFSRKLFVCTLVSFALASTALTPVSGYAANPAKAETRFAYYQYLVYAIGVAVQIISLYFLYLGYPAMEPIVGVSSLVVLVGVLMFAVIIFGKQPVAGGFSSKARA